MYKNFINRPIFAMVISIVIVLLGALAITRLPVEQYPDITPPVVEVTASYPGADAEVVADAVATPIGESVMGTDNMLYMQSTSAGDGSMTLQILFEVGSDADMDQVFAQNNVATATPLLPAEVTRQGVTTQKIQTGFLLVYALHSDGRYDSKFLSNYAYINLRNELLKIDGVGKVQIMGAGEYSMRIWIRPDLLDYYDLSVEEIASAVEQQSGTFPAGKFGQEPMSTPTDFTYTVTLPAEITTPEEYANIIVKTLPDGEQLRLSDVARVELGTESYGVDSSFDGEPGALMVVYQEPSSNAMEVGRQVKATMATLAERFPSGVEYDTVVDATLSIGEGVREIVKTLLFALVLVVLIIFLFLQDVRATLIPLVAIPVSLVGAFMLFPLLGFSVNIISLLGLVLAIGLVVDDAIIVVEATQAHIERGMAPREATAKAMRSVAQPIVATTVVLLAVFVPVSFIGGVAGKLFQQFSVGISVAVVISAFNALSLSPALCSLLLRPAREKNSGF
ncbi:MAG: efflux RND transporter permease subunit, partial [Tidjanibacter sp.]|nr:efflux RND transporter permease subunit [Tidjanibacter sp.]